jgi:hypothetical protein
MMEDVYGVSVELTEYDIMTARSEDLSLRLLSAVLLVLRDRLYDALSQLDPESVCSNGETAKQQIERLRHQGQRRLF